MTEAGEPIERPTVSILRRDEPKPTATTPAVHVEQQVPLDHSPSPQEIRAACESIQATWSDVERAKRAGRLTIVHHGKTKVRPWQPPSVRWGGASRERDGE